jgi:hypothetical protein
MDNIEIGSYIFAIYLFNLYAASFIQFKIPQILNSQTLNYGSTVDLNFRILLSFGYVNNIEAYLRIKWTYLYMDLM